MGWTFYRVGDLLWSGLCTGLSGYRRCFQLNNQIVMLIKYSVCIFITSDALLLQPVLLPVTGLDELTTL